jgi:hypothetical protein
MDSAVVAAISRVEPPNHRDSLRSVNTTELIRNGLSMRQTQQRTSRSTAHGGLLVRLGLSFI